MEGAPAESHAEIPAQLRQRMLSRASTFAEGVRPATPNTPRRRSSLLSTRSSTDSLRTLRNNDMDRATVSDDHSSWLHSSSVLVAIVPAVAALIHPQGGTLATDLVLLSLSAWFLGRQWYVDAQQRQYLDAEDAEYDDTIYEEEEGSTGTNPESTDPVAEGAEDAGSPSTEHTPPIVDPRESARSKLKRIELLALAACFLAPVAAAYVVHYLRSQFTHRARDGIVTDLNLFFYVCVAEARPVSHLFDMIGKQTLHLQRLVAEPPEQPRSGIAQRLPQRLAALEARLDDPVSNDIDMNRITNEVRQTMQYQLDALNRAVRKYEKKQLAQTMQIEARFQDIDVRLRDTLSLAASAARTGQKPGIAATTLTWLSGLLAYVVQMAWDVALYPFRVALSVVEAVKTSFSKDRRYAGRRTNVHSSMSSTSRMQSKSGR
ncbi:hypothetical protein HBI51_112170 [Parastagonospora nodorum]|nr:hypothetical protein HBI51_112170 [Parastagonospora nodorum]